MRLWTGQPELRSHQPLRVIAHTPSGTTDTTATALGSYANGVFSITASGPVGSHCALQGSENLRE